MLTEEKITPRIIKQVDRMRFTGWFLFIGGLIGCLDVVPKLFDSQASIVVNGEPTNSFSIKLTTAIFVAIFPLLGGLLAFTSKMKLQRLLAALDRKAKGWGKKHF